MKLPWNGGCCVCNKPTDKRKRVSCSASTGGIPNVYEKIQTLEMDIPCCQEHPYGADAHGDGAVSFQSYDYWREFLRLNGRRS